MPPATHFDKLQSAINKMCYSYNIMPEFFSEAWDDKKSVKICTPSKMINNAIKIYKNEVLPLIAKRYVSRHKVKSLLEMSDYKKRFKQYHKPLINAAIIPLLQSTLRHELTEYHSIIKNHDDDMFDKSDAASKEILKRCSELFDTVKDFLGEWESLAIDDISILACFYDTTNELCLCRESTTKASSRKSW